MESVSKNDATDAINQTIESVNKLILKLIKYLLK